jgi:hypothetical protein
MPLTSTPAYIVTVGADHTVVLPKEIPVGSQVTITVIPSSALDQQDDAARHARFGETLAALQSASTTGATPATVSDADLDSLIKKARKAS